METVKSNIITSRKSQKSKGGIRYEPKILIFCNNETPLKHAIFYVKHTLA